MSKTKWSTLFALAAVALALAPVAGTAHETFKAQFSGSAYGTHAGKYWVFTAAGNGTHVGSFSLEASYHFYGRTRIVGFMTITAANGHVLQGSCEHTWDAATTTWVGTYTFTGGTGIFANATGRGDFDVALDLTAGTAAGTLDGTITY